MNKEIKNSWIIALRSGLYRQALETLYEPKSDGYCCLGVLCAITNQPRIDSGKFTSGYADYLMTFEVGELFGIDMKTLGVLTDMNDIDRLNFTEIADYIESKL